jgi:hypothetical protein
MNFKLALVAAAVVGAASTAQAADLAKKAPAAANYVKVCDAYGAGFFYIPGSDTCLKIGGYVQATYSVLSNNKATGGIWGWQRGQNGIATQARAHINLDARTNTELGLLRSFADIEFNNGSYGAASGLTNIGLKKAFIQFGGLTAGRATSFFDFFNGDYTENAWFEASHSDANVNLLAYTFTFGNGITATLSVEDPSTSDDNGRRATLGAPYGGVHSPDLVANVNVAQAWGSAQAMAALHMDDAANGTVDQNKAGFALGAGVKVNLPALGSADQFALQVEYAKGAVGYIGYLDGVAVDFATGSGRIAQNSAWAVAAGFTHGFTKTITGNLEASYARYTTDRANGNNDFNQWNLNGNLTWSPVTNLAIIGELEYQNVDYSAASGLADKHGLIGVIRVRRSF